MARPKNANGLENNEYRVQDDIRGKTATLLYSAIALSHSSSAERLAFSAWVHSDTWLMISATVSMTSLRARTWAGSSRVPSQRTDKLTSI